jgi:DNA-binding MarR family transcriptional regulator
MQIIWPTGGVVSIPVPSDAHAVYRRYLSAVVLNSLAHAEAAGLHPTDLYALNLLALDAPLTAGVLAERTGLTSGATTRLIDRLERRGHVRRVVDPGDRRRILIDVVPPAEAGADDVFGPARRRIAEVFAGFTAEQVEVLFAYFDRAATAFQEATEETRRGLARGRDGT